MEDRRREWLSIHVLPTAAQIEPHVHVHILQHAGHTMLAHVHWRNTRKNTHHYLFVRRLFELVIIMCVVFLTSSRADVKAVRDLI